MSFSLTTPQMRAKSKTVTRRRGWWNLKRNEVVMAVQKGQGLKRGEKVVRIGPIEVASSTPEPLSAITYGDCVLEGFPELSPAEFVKMFCEHNDCGPDEPVNRIEFKHLY